MKMRFIASVLILVLSLSVLLTGCFTERNVNVVFKLEDGTIYHAAAVDNFSSELIPEFPGDQVPSGMEFLGWGFTADQTENLLPDGGLVTVQYIADSLGKTDASVVMYPVFGEKVVIEYDLVVGWYNLPATSGMTEEIADAYKAALEEHLASIGKEGLLIDVRPYEGNVAATGAKILEDGDVDILMGWGGNLTSKGEVPTVERAGSMKLGEVEGRYIDLISEDELAKIIFDWTVENAAILAR